MFADTHGSDSTTLRESWHAGQSAEAGHIADSAKGAAGTLGLGAVQEASEALQAEPRDGAPSGATVEQMVKALDARVAAITALARDVETAPHPQPPASAMEATLDRVESHLATADFSVNSRNSSAWIATS